MTAISQAEEISPATLAQMVESAFEAYTNAQCPHSKYQVGAALLTTSGEIFNGCNVENSICKVLHAEENAQGSAATKGHRVFKAILVTTKDGQGLPCGFCRQLFIDSSPNMHVYTANPDKKIVHQTSLDILLPNPFGAHNIS